MSIVITDATSYYSKTPNKLLETAEKDKKKKYLDACLKKLQQFTPFVISVYGLLGVQVWETLNRISSQLTTKWKEPYSRTYGYVRSRVEITLF